MSLDKTDMELHIHLYSVSHFTAFWTEDFFRWTEDNKRVTEDADCQYTEDEKKWKHDIPALSLVI